MSARPRLEIIQLAQLWQLKLIVPLRAKGKLPRQPKSKNILLVYVPAVLQYSTPQSVTEEV